MKRLEQDGQRPAEPIEPSPPLEDLMKPADDQFQPLDAQLMLLVAGELPADEAEALRERIQADPALAVRSDALAEQLSGVETLLASGDRAQPVSPLSERVARNEACRAVRTWVDRDLRPEPKVVAPSAIETAVWRYARWPLAAAAAVVVGLILLPWLLDTTNQGGLRADGRGESGSGSYAASDAFERRLPEWGGREGSRGEGRGEGVPIEGRDMPVRVNPSDPSADETDPGERLALLFDSPAGQWDIGGDEGFQGLDLQSHLRDELATVQALGDAWSDDGF